MNRVRRQNPFIVASASLFGTAIEQYDYVLYGLSAALVFNTVFFPGLGQTGAVLASLATFGVAFLARPLGGLVFGHYGDLLGRKKTLLVSFMLMGFTTILVGAIPSYHAIGILAPIILVLLRFIQGFALGGEWGGAALNGFENADHSARGVMASWAQVGVPVGLILANVTFLATQSLMAASTFLAWGWRIPFLGSAVLIIVGIILRYKLGETRDFEEIRASGDRMSNPIKTVLKEHWRSVLILLCSQAALNIGYFILLQYTLTYGSVVLGLESRVMIIAIIVAAALNIPAQIFFAKLSDRIGRRPIMIAGSAFFALWAFPLFALLNTGSQLMVIIAIAVPLTFGHAAAYSVTTSFAAELFPPALRYSGMSLGYNGAAVFWSGPTPFVAAYLFSIFGSTTPISFMLISGSAISVLGLVFLHRSIARKGHVRGTAGSLPTLAEA